MHAGEDAAAETAAILADSALMAAIREGLADAEAGRLSTHQQIVDEHVRRRSVGTDVRSPSED